MTMYSRCRLNDRNELTTAVTFKNPDWAFREAIAVGRLLTEASAVNYAGQYMYMGSQGRDLFKNINTRKYDV